MVDIAMHNPPSNKNMINKNYDDEMMFELL